MLKYFFPQARVSILSVPGLFELGARHEIKVQEITNWMKMRKSDNFKLVSKQLELENQDKFNYILLIGEDYQFSNQQYELISNMKWSLIVDYTRKSVDGGLYRFFHNETINRHRITPTFTCIHTNKNHFFF